MKKIALITALVIGTASVALADEFDPNLANRYPSYAAPKLSRCSKARRAGRRPDRQRQSQTFDRASNPNAGGV